MADLPVGILGHWEEMAHAGGVDALAVLMSRSLAAGHSSESPRRSSETSSSHGVAVILISSSAGIGSMMRVSCS